MLTKRRYLRYNKDAEANDMIHMGSDHRMCHGDFHDHHAWKEQPLQDYKRKTRNNKAWKKGPNRKNIEIEKLELEKKYQEIIDFLKNRRHKKQQRKQKVKMQKHKQKMRTQQQQQKQNVKMLKRKQKKSKECAQET